jgi:hypothetical protein
MAEEVVTSTPASGDTGASVTPAVATPTVTAQPVATTPAAQPSATGGEQSREGWVPSYRVRETREAAQREFQQERARLDAEHRTELQRIQSQLHALVGVQPKQNPEIDAVRQQFAQLYPGLAKLEARGQDIEGLLERAGDLEAQNEHYWNEYGRRSVNTLFTEAEKTLGSPLSDEAKRVLHSSFIGFVQSSPELTQRYSNDPTIVNDFVRAFSSSLIDPVRRSATATVAGRVATAIPQDTPGGAVHPAGAPKPANLDERAEQAWALYKTTAKP